MGQVVFERVQPGDAEATALLAAYHEELQSRLSLTAVRWTDRWDPLAFAAPGGVVLVARLEARAVGCGGLRSLGPGVGEVKHLFVLSEARGRGVARGLLHALERFAIEAGHRTLVLDTAAPLVEASALYRSAGYREVAPYNTNPHAAAWFEKDLSDSRTRVR